MEDRQTMVVVARKEEREGGEKRCSVQVKCVASDGHIEAILIRSKTEQTLPFR